MDTEDSIESCGKRMRGVRHRGRKAFCNVDHAKSSSFRVWYFSGLGLGRVEHVSYRYFRKATGMHELLAEILALHATR